MHPTVISGLIGAVSGVALIFLGSWQTDRRTRRADAATAAKAARASLEADAAELVEAVLALQLAGFAHDHFRAGWQPRLRVGLTALAHGSSELARSRALGPTAVLAALGEVARHIDRWDQETVRSAEQLALPLTRLAAAMPPLMRRPAMAEAAERVYEAATRHPGGLEVKDALTAFHTTLRSALETV